MSYSINGGDGPSDISQLLELAAEATDRGAVITEIRERRGYWVPAIVVDVHRWRIGLAMHRSPEHMAVHAFLSLESFSRIQLGRLTRKRRSREESTGFKLMRAATLQRVTALLERKRTMSPVWMLTEGAAMFTTRMEAVGFTAADQVDDNGVPLWR